MELFGSNIKKILILSQKEAFLIFAEMEFSSSNTKKYYYVSSKTTFSYIFSNETLYFLPQAQTIKEIHPEKKFLCF